MKFKKAKYLASFLFLITLMSLPILSSAQTALNNPLTGQASGNLEDAVKNVISGALGISGVLALIAFIYGGIVWMTSGGDSSKVQKGKNMMIWAVWGIVIIFSAYAILSYIFTALVGNGGGANAPIGSDTPAVNPKD